MLELGPAEDWNKPTTEPFRNLEPELLTMHTKPDLAPAPLDEIPKQEDINDSDLSELDSFKPISELLSMGGDLARRVQYILEIFGHDHNDVEQPLVKPRRGNSSLNKVPGLVAGSSEGRKRRFGASRAYRRN
jgi:hypothetical protein